MGHAQFDTSYPTIHIFLCTVENAHFSLNLRRLTLVKWRDESGATRQLRIVRAIGAKWREVAALLGLSVCQMDGIQQQCSMNTEQCCVRIFDGWIISNGEFTNYTPSHGVACMNCWRTSATEL